MNRSENINRNIADLPVELLLTIFKLVDKKSYQSVNRVCKSWKALTDNCFKWTLYLNRRFGGDVWSDLIRAGTSKHITNIYIEGNERNVMNFFAKQDHVFTSAITNISINHTTFHLIELNNLLATFPNLKELILCRVKLPGSNTSDLQLSDDDKPECKHLKKLFLFDGMDNELLQCLTKSKLHKLCCRQQRFTRYYGMKFLSTQKELREIDFCRESSNSALSFGMGTSVAMPALTRFELDYKTVSDFDGIEALLLHQPNSFESVGLGHVPMLPVLTSIFKNLKNLKSLHLMPGIVRHSASSELVLQPLQSVTHLSLYSGANYGLDSASMEKMTNEIIKNLPNLEDLELFLAYRQSFYQSIVTNLKKLKSLSIRVTFHTNLKCLKYPHVETLRIECFDYVSSKIPPISMIEEGEASEINESVRSLIYDGVADSVFLSFVRYTFPKLEVLELRNNSKVREPTVGIRCVRYRDSSFFDRRMQFAC